jgi:DNA-binding CsgD family transcriptional regulator
MNARSAVDLAGRLSDSRTFGDTVFSHDTLSGLIASLDRPAFVLDRDGRLLEANVAGMLETVRRGLVVSDEGLLLPADCLYRDLWVESLRAALIQRHSALVLRRGPATQSYAFRAFHPAESGEPASCVLVTQCRADCSNPMVLSSFARVHGLTVCETATLAHLCSGLSAGEIARRRGVKESTIRAHVKSVLQKTMQNSVRMLQAELSRLSAV